MAEYIEEISGKVVVVKNGIDAKQVECNDGYKARTYISHLIIFLETLGSFSLQPTTGWFDFQYLSLFFFSYNTVVTRKMCSLSQTKLKLIPTSRI